jgi:hypothetical protein
MSALCDDASPGASQPWWGGGARRSHSKRVLLGKPIPERPLCGSRQGSLLTEDTIDDAAKEQFPKLEIMIVQPIGPGRWAMRFADPQDSVTSQLQGQGLEMGEAVYDFEQVVASQTTGLLGVNITGWWSYSLDDDAAKLEFQRILDNVEVHIKFPIPGAADTGKGIAQVLRFIQLHNAATPKLGSQYAQALIALTKQPSGHRYPPPARLRREVRGHTESGTALDTLHLVYNRAKLG